MGAAQKVVRRNRPPLTQADMVNLVSCMERFALPLFVRQYLYDRALASATRGSRVIGRQTIIMMRDYYGLDRVGSPAELAAMAARANDKLAAPKEAK